MSATANLSQAQASSGASELASAARSLESVQGNVSGQTMAIQQMTMAGQQQSTNLNMLLNQLSTQVAGLNQAVMQMAGATRMASMPQPMHQQQAMGPPMTAAGGAGFGQMAMTGGGYTFRGLGMANTGLQAAGGFFGRGGAMMAQPFLGGDVYSGGIRPQLGQEVGVLRGFGLASGIGLRPEMMKTASAEQVMALGRERMANRAGDAFLGAVGGAGHLGLALGGEALGSMAMGALGIGGIGGFAGSMLAGGAIAAAGGLAINETMDQAGNIRGFGEQFGRNAHRFMGSVPSTGLRMPGRASRQTFGREMNRMSIQDLTFNAQDVQEMFATMTEQDLMQGARNTQEVVQRMRQAKEAFKVIGLTMGQGIREASETMGIMQSLGINPMGIQGRAAIFGASSIPGMKPGDAMRRSGEFGQRYVNIGGGAGGLRTMQTSLRSGQMAINEGLLSKEEVASFGGREGVGEAMAHFQDAFMGSELGRASILAGSGSFGLGVHDTLTLGSKRAMDPNRLLELESGKLQKEYLDQDPYLRRMDQYAKISSLADEIQRGDRKISRRNAMVTAMKSIDRTLTDMQAGALLKQFENTGKEVERSRRDRVRLAGEQASSQAHEQFGIINKIKRSGQRMFTEPAEYLEDAATNFGDLLGRTSHRVEQSLMGVKDIDISEGLDLELIQSLKRRGSEAKNREEKIPLIQSGGDPGVKRAIQLENMRIEERNKLRDDQDLIDKQTPSAQMREKYRAMAQGAVQGNASEIRKAKEIIRDPSSTGMERRGAMKKLLSIASNDNYDSFDASGKGGGAVKRAIQDAVLSAYGVDPASVLTGNETAKGLSFSKEKQDRLTELRNELNSLTGATGIEGLKYESPEVMNYIRALSSGGIGEAKAIADAADPELQEQFNKINKLFKDKDSFLTVHHATRGESKFESLEKFAFGDFAKELRSLKREEAGAARMGIIGRGAARMLEKARVSPGGKTGSLLQSQQVGDITEGLGRLIELSDDDLNKLGDSKMARTIKALKEAMSNDSVIDEKEARIIQGIVPSLKIEEVLENGTRAGDLGEIIAAASDFGTVRGLTTTVGKEGFTNLQIETMQTMKNEMDRISLMLMDIEVRLREGR